MIYCVEGNVHVGKSTFVQGFIKEHKSFFVVPETEFPLSLPPYERQKFYIDSEKIKFKNFSNADLILDRSILSVLVYTMLSKELSLSQKTLLLEKIKSAIANKEIFLPSSIFFVMLPFDLVCFNQELLGKTKNTEELLATYEYYLNYNKFFVSNLLNKNVHTVSSRDFRQIISFDPAFLYQSLSLELKKENTKILLDSFSESVVTLDTKKTIAEILASINRLKGTNKIIQNGFLNLIANLFAQNELSREKKANLIETICESAPLFLICNAIVFNQTASSEKQNNTARFYEEISKELGFKSNITILKNCENPEKFIEENISHIGKDLLLIDLFFAIKKCVLEGKI